MFEVMAAADADGAVPEPTAPVTAPVSAATLRSWIAGLARLDRSVVDAGRVTQLELRCATTR